MTDGGEQWWYRTDAASVEGPVSTQTFLSLFAEGYVDGLTSISTSPRSRPSDWLPLSEHPRLSEAVRAAAPPSSDEEPAPDAAAPPPSDEEPAPDAAAPAEVEPTAPRPGDPRRASEQFPQPPDAARAAPGAPPPAPSAKSAEARERKRQARKRARHAARLRARQNTAVYVSGLPDDASEPEVAAFFAKCGILLPNPHTGRPRVKLYRRADGALKGDAMVTYALRPSVENAVALLDGVPLREGGPLLAVQEASFDHKRPRVAADNAPPGERSNGRVVISGKHLVEEALSWADDGQHKGSAPRIVILKNVFDPASADYDMVREDMSDGCEACGEVEKITVFERNADGAVAVKFTSIEACLKCIEVMNGRWYDGRKLHAAFYDGVTDYRHKETEEERKQREDNWQSWLQGDQDGDHRAALDVT